MTVRDELIQTLDQLTPQQQTHLLSVARQLQAASRPAGTSGRDMIALLDTLTFEEGEVERMLTAIQEGQQMA